MSYVVLNGLDGKLVDVSIDQVEVAADRSGVFLEKSGMRVFVPVSGSAPFVFESERRAPHRDDKEISLLEVMQQMRAARV